MICDCLLCICFYTCFNTYYLLTDDEGGSVKPIGLNENRKSNQNDLQLRLGLLFGDGIRNKRHKQHKSVIRDSCTSLASLDANTLASNNTSPVIISTFVIK